LSGPSFNDRSSIAFPRARQACPSERFPRRDLLVRSADQRWIIHRIWRGLKSRAQSGAKAPHSIWSAAIHRRFWVKALAFTTSPLALFSHHHEICLPVGAIHELPLHYRRDPLVGFVFRRDPLVGSDEHRLMPHAASPGTTSVPLRGSSSAVEGAPPHDFLPRCNHVVKMGPRKRMFFVKNTDQMARASFPGVTP